MVIRNRGDYCMDVVELSRKLVDIPSITGQEADVGRFLVAHLEWLRYRVQVQELSPGRSNILATTEEPPRLVFSTHMDTVPPFVASSENDEYIYGRGSCDAKGILAAQITAAEQLRAEGIQEVGLLFTVDEEAGGGGARLANTHPLARNCWYLINGEPTDNRLATGSKGSLRVRLRTSGRAAHSAYPEQGESAIEKLLEVLAAVRAVAWPADDFLGETTCNIGTIGGGEASNVIPAQASADLHLRLVTPSSTAKNLLEGAVAGRALVDYLSVAEPIRLHSVDGFEQCIVRYTTDIPCLTAWGQPLLFGPGSILVAHTANERVAKRELLQAVESYVRLAQVLKARHENDAVMGARR